jgi:hypothetical protein
VVPVPNRTATAAKNITVSLTGLSLPSGLIGTPYAGFDFKSLLNVTGDPAYNGYGVKWTVVAGSLPSGLTLNSNGTLSGTPTAAGTSSFQVMASYKSKAGQQAYQVQVANITVGLAAGAPPQALVGQAYSYDLKPLLSVSGDSAYTGAGVTWTVVSSSLPTGLYLTSDGFIGGTPTAGGTGSITARASYKGVNGQQTYQVVSLAVSVALAAGTPPQALVGQAYSYSLNSLLSVDGDSAFNGSGVTWSVVSSTLLAGLYLTNDGWIGGTPTASGSGTITARATYRGVSGQQTYQVVTLNLAVGLAAGAPPQAIIGQAYSYSLSSLLTVNGDPGFNGSGVTWSQVSNSLPAGLSLGPDGTVIGTPTAAGTGSITARASYRGVDGQQTYQVVSLNIAVTLATATPAQAIVGQAYTYDLKPLLTVSGDAGYSSANVTWSVDSGSLPAGLSLGTTGVITGTPTAAGTGSIAARATYRGVNGTQTYQVVTLNITVALANATATAATADDVYSYDLKPLLSVAGDSSYQVSAVTWALSSGTLPTGLTLNTTTGVISGTPARSSTGTSTFGVTASYRSKTGQGSYTINVAMAPAKPRWSVTTLSLGNASLSGTSNTATATLYNDGGLAGNWTSLSNLGSGVTADASGCSSVAPSASCVVTFTFKPTVIGTVNLSGITPTASASRAVNTLTITAAGVQRILALSPAVSGKSSWNLDTDGPLRLAAAGTYTVVPATSMNISTKLWGAGGGGGGADAAPYYSGVGGGGGYVGGTYVAAKSVSMTFNVGGGGGSGIGASGAGGGAGGWNGGGKGGNAGLQGSSGGGGGGGGLTELVVNGSEIACAGGGGGGGGDGNVATNGNNNGNYYGGWTTTKTGASGAQRSDDGGGPGGGGGGCNGGQASTYFPASDSNAEGGAYGASVNYGLSGAAAAQPAMGGAAANSADADVGSNAHGGINATTSGAAAGTAGVVVLR